MQLSAVMIIFIFSCFEVPAQVPSSAGFAHLSAGLSAENRESKK